MTFNTKSQKGLEGGETFSSSSSRLCTISFLLPDYQAATTRKKTSKLTSHNILIFFTGCLSKLVIFIAGHNTLAPMFLVFTV